MLVSLPIQWPTPAMSLAFLTACLRSVRVTARGRRVLLPVMNVNEWPMSACSRGEKASAKGRQDSLSGEGQPLSLMEVFDLISQAIERRLN